MKNYLIAFLTIILLFAMLIWTFYSSASTEGLHITSLGDSITHGTGDSSKQGYIIRVKRKIEEKKNIPVEISNLGVPKYTTENILDQMKDRKVRKQLEAADYITLYIGTNDFRKSANYNFEELNLKKISQGRSAFTRNLNNILYNIREENTHAPIVVLGLYHPYIEYKNQLEIKDEIKIWNREIMDLTRTYEQTYYISTLELFANKQKKEFFSDSLHPNSTGYELIAEKVFKEIILLEEKLNVR